MSSSTATLSRHARELRPAALVVAPNILWPLALAVAVGALLQYAVAPNISGYSARILLEIGTAAILAISLNVVNGFTGQFSIGHAGFLAIGGYVAGASTYYVSMLVWGDYEKHLSFGIWPGEALLVGSCLLGGLAAAGAGYAVGLPSLRLRGDYLAIVTLGFGEIVRVLFQQTGPQIFEADELRQTPWAQLLWPPPLGGAQGFSDIPKYTNLFWVYVFVVLTTVFSLRLKLSSAGRAMLSIREDEIAAQAMGIDVTKWKVRAFVYAAFFGGLAGGLIAHQSGTLVRPVDAGFQRSFEIIIMVVLGGMGSISGVVLAAVIVTVLPQLLLEPPSLWWPSAMAIVLVLLVQRGRAARTVIALIVITLIWELTRLLSLRFGVNLAEFRMAIYALALILLMIFRPQGLFGVREIWDFLPRRRPPEVAA